MQYTIHSWCEAVFNCWQQSSTTDFAQLLLGIVVLGWYLSRLTAR